MFGLSWLIIVAGIPGLIISMVVHEYAHARVAVALGDFTPRMMGRLTLNPLAHIDPIGMLMLLFVQFGWAKPVMINPRNFKNVRRDDCLVSLAGPLANLLTAFFAVCVMRLYVFLGLPQTQGVVLVWQLIVIFNINFAIFNMLPLPPLDGSKVLMTFLPGRWAYKLMSLERYSFLILILLFITPIGDVIFRPLSQAIQGIFYLMLGIIF